MFDHIILYYCPQQRFGKWLGMTCNCIWGTETAFKIKKQNQEIKYSSRTLTELRDNFMRTMTKIQDLFKIVLTNQVQKTDTQISRTTTATWTERWSTCVETVSCCLLLLRTVRIWGRGVNSGFQVTGMIKGLMFVFKIFDLRIFLGKKILASEYFLWVAWFKYGFFFGIQNNLNIRDSFSILSNTSKL